MGLFSRDLGIDLGTANTLVHVKDRGVVLSEPSVVATDTHTARGLAVGAEAKKMGGRTPSNIVAPKRSKAGRRRFPPEPRICSFTLLRSGMSDVISLII